MADGDRVGRTIYERAVMLDTGPLISLYDPQDNRRGDIHAIMQQMQRLRYPVCITLLVIAETHRRILYDIGYKPALEFLKAINDGSVQILKIEKKDVINAIDVIERYPDQQISCTDAMSMAVMKRIGIQKVLSYDWHFGLLNFSVLPAA